MLQQKGSGSSSRQRFVVMEVPYTQFAAAERFLLPRARARTVRTVHFCMIAGLVLASSLGQLVLALRPDGYGLRGLLFQFYVDGEFRLPAFYSSFLLACCAWLLYRVSTEPAVTKVDRRYWLSLAFGFALLAIDELFAFHERSITPLQSVLDIDSGVLFYAWVAPALVLIVGLAAVYTRFVWRLPPPVRLGVIVGGCFYLGGAIGFEMLSGAFDAAQGSANPREHVGYQVLVTVEESLEMVGAVIFLTTVLVFRDRFLNRGATSAPAV